MINSEGETKRKKAISWRSFHRSGFEYVPLFIFVAIIVCCLLPGTSQAQVQSGASSQNSPQEVPSSGAVRPAAQDILQTNEVLTKMAQLKAARRGEWINSDYIIGPMDSIEISVFSVPELAKTLQVSNEGKITLPLLGPVQAAGLTARELELVIAELLRQKYVKNPQVSVTVREYKNQPPVIVFGAVRNPGPVQLFGSRSLIEILAQAGGFTEDVGRWISIRRGRVGRGNPNIIPSDTGSPKKNTDRATDVPKEPPNPHDTIKIDMKQMLSYDNPESNPLLFPGDMVDVSKAGVVYVVGDVNRPGGFVLKELSNISIVRALALAEGVKGTAAKSRARIYRPKDDGSQEEIAVNLSNVLKGKNTDLQLRGGDILFVPVSGTKSFLRRGFGGFAQSAINTSGYALYRF